MSPMVHVTTGAPGSFCFLGRVAMCATLSFRELRVDVHLCLRYFLIDDMCSSALNNGRLMIMFLRISSMSSKFVGSFCCFFLRASGNGIGTLSGEDGGVEDEAPSFKGGVGGSATSFPLRRVILFALGVVG